MDLKHINKVYFLGIGGIGMSALAHYFHQEGKVVSGYDRVSSVVTERLENEGMKVFYVLDKSHVEGQDVMIYTPAISRDCVEYVAAEAAGIPILKRSQALGVISQTYRTLAVAGTHGKTTTSSMLAHLLRACGLDCTAFLGGLSRNLKGNFAYGQSELLVVEADEFDRSFLTLKPESAIVTSMDPDHLDIYGDATEMERNYLAFGALAKELLVHHSLKDRGWTVPVSTFGIEEGDIQAHNLRFSKLRTQFDFAGEGQVIRDLSLSMPGHHNVMNMLAAIGLSLRVGADPERLKAAVAEFSGIYRRFEVWHHTDSLTYVDDYAHHPTEIAAAIDTARRLFPNRKLIVVFQPHLFSRTRDFAAGFVAELSKADALLLMEIYPAREEPIPGVNSKMLFDQITLTQKFLVSPQNMLTHLEKVLSEPAVLLTLGAGDIDREVDKITDWIKDVSFGSNI
jgi:UDP-N-acetylmuramate--alanine ligase